jgi:hypothetical protein
VVAGEHLGASASLGKQYALFIAIDAYRHWGGLKKPVADAREIRDILTSQYYIDEVVELYNGDATKQNIIRTFTDLQRRLGLNDSLFIYYAGHGHLDNASKAGFWIPVDGGTDEYAQENWLPNSQIRGYISGFKTIHVFMVSDACFSGDILNTTRALPPRIDNEYYRRAYNLVSRQVLTSGSSETVPDDSEFSAAIKFSLRKNTAPLLDPVGLYNDVRLSVRSSTPLYGTLNQANHQEGATFLFFRRGAETASSGAVTPAFSTPAADTPREVLFPSPFRVKTIGQYRLNQKESIRHILVAPGGESYTLIYEKNAQSYEAYVKQGNQTFGPFVYVEYGNEYGKGVWYAKNQQNQYFLGTAKTVNGPISNLAAIASIQNIDDRRLAFTADLETGQYIFQNGLRREGPYDDIKDLNIAPLTGKIAYAYKTGQGNYIMADGKSHGPYNGDWWDYRTRIIGWSGNGQKCAYIYTHNKRRTIVYGDKAIGTYADNSTPSFGPDGETLFYIGDGRLYRTTGSGSEPAISDNNNTAGPMVSYALSPDASRLAYSYRMDDRRYYVVLPLPGGGIKTYGPFSNWPEYNFSPNSKIFYCTGSEAGMEQPVMYINDEKYTVDGYGIRPVFTSGDNRYAAFIAEIRYLSLSTDTMSVNVSDKMESAILPDGTPVYWTEQSYQVYQLHISYNTYGPFDYAGDLSDREYIRWVLCDKGAIQLIELKR